MVEAADAGKSDDLPGSGRFHYLARGRLLAQSSVSAVRLFRTIEVLGDIAEKTTLKRRQLTNQPRPEDAGLGRPLQRGRAHGEGPAGAVNLDQ